jgi:EAL domain-containing protein (putative c-di-GMP-specific phosphodiesterase class I)
MKDRRLRACGPFFAEIAMTMTEQLSALSSILAQSSLHSLFQPIICLSERRILGYEALSRGPSNSPLHSPSPCSPSPARPGA